MKSKRIQSCWPATIYRRLAFRPPTQYSHRTGRTATHVLTRAKHLIEELVAFDRKMVGGVWDLGDKPEPCLPRRAEDMLLLLISDKGLSLRARGAKMLLMADAYVVPLDEALRAVTALQGWVEEEPRGDDQFTVTLTHALRAVKNAHYHLGSEPIVP